MVAGEHTGGAIHWLSSFEFDRVEAALVMLAMPLCESKWQPSTGDNVRISRSRLGSVLARLSPPSLSQDLELLWSANNAHEQVVSANRGTYLLSGSPSIETIREVKAMADTKRKNMRGSHARLHQSARASESLAESYHPRHGAFAPDGHDGELGKAAVVAAAAAWRSCCCRLSCCLFGKTEEAVAEEERESSIFPKTVHDLSRCPLCSRLCETVDVELVS
jgi:hypothetical protein